MKIAMLGHKYVPSREGGIEIVVEQLSTIMTSRGHSVTIFNRKRSGYKKITEYKGCSVESVYTINQRAFDALVYTFFATLKAKKKARKGQFDVLHFHAEGPCFFLNLLPKKKKRKYKIVVTIHGLDWQRGKWGGFASKILLKGEKNAVKYADEIIVLSESNRKYFKEKYGRETTLIPNGVAEPVFHKPEIITEKWGLKKDSYVLFLARIVPEKGVHYLIEAWNKLKEEINTDKKLVIAGGSSHTDDYFNKIAESCKDNDSIIMTGFVEGQELQELYTNNCLYVLPSDIEGMPMSLLEAISYGNTCLVSDIPENANVIQDCGYKFKKGDVNDLTAKLKDILTLDNPEKRTDVPITTSWDEVVDKTLELYEREK